MKKTEYLKLVNDLNNHCYKYYVQSSPEISDEEYDKQYQVLKEAEKNNPDLLVSYSPTQRIGSPIKSGLPTQERQIKMMSLDNAFTLQDFEAFSSKLYDEELAVELKLDGAGLELIYVFGRLTTALSRGNGTSGEVITHVAKAIKTIPLYIPELDDIELIEIRGEVIMPYTVVQEYKKQHPEKETISPRNLASGALRLLDPKQIAERKLTFIPHSVGSFPEGFITSFKDFNTKCKAWKFQTVSTQICSSNVGVANLYNRFIGYRSKLPFAADGLVIKVNDFSRHEVYGETVKYPKWAIAWKFPAEEKETILRDIVPQTGRTGVVTPVAIFDPIELSGAIVSKATLHNYDEIKRKDIRIGDTIIVSRSGDVIPKVIRVLPEKRTHYAKKVIPPELCPDCNQPLIKQKTYINCKNYKCKGKVIARMIHFASRNAMDIKGFGDSMAEFFYSQDITTLSEIMNIERSSLPEGLLYDNLIDSIEKAKHNVEPSRLLFGLGIYGVGEVQAELIIKQLFTQDLGLRDLLTNRGTVYKLTEVDGIGDVTLNNINNFLNKESLVNDAVAVYESIKSWKLPEKSESNKFAGQTFVITGTLSKPRKEIEKYIKDNQGKVSGSVSKKTSCLIVGTNPGNDKVQAAKLHNVKTITEGELYG